MPKDTILAEAIRALGIDVPVMKWEAVEPCVLKIVVLGGREYIWRAEEEEGEEKEEEKEKEISLRRKKKEILPS